MIGEYPKKCSCGRMISRHLQGKCLACRYRAGRAQPIRLKVDPRRLPAPRIAPTRACRIDIREKKERYEDLYMGD